MGRINVVIPDQLEKDIKKKAIDKFGGMKGGFGMAVKEALELWLKSQK